MKKLFSAIVMASALAAMTACSATRTASVPVGAELAQQQLVKQMLDEKIYKVDFTTAFPQTGRSFPLNYPYFVSIIGSRVESFLPYFGRAYTVPYGGGEGLRFEAPVENYTVGQGKKGQQEIRFDAKTAEDNYTFYLEVYPSGDSYLTINATNKQGMSFSGAIDTEPEFEFEVIRVEP